MIELSAIKSLLRCEMRLHGSLWELGVCRLGKWKLTKFSELHLRSIDVVILKCIEMINMFEYEKYAKIHVSFKWAFL